MVSGAENYGDSFDFAGHHFEVECEPLIAEDIDRIQDEVRKDNFSGARMFAIGLSVKLLTKDGEVIIKRPPRSAWRVSANTRPAGRGIPTDYDPAIDKFLYEKLVELIVRNVPWLATRPALAPAFEEYAPDEDAAEPPMRPDPTPPPAPTITGS